MTSAPDTGLCICTPPRPHRRTAFKSVYARDVRMDGRRNLVGSAGEEHLSGWRRQPTGGLLRDGEDIRVWQVGRRVQDRPQLTVRVRLEESGADRRLRADEP